MVVECGSCTKANRLPPARIAERARCAACKAPLLPLSRPIPIRDANDFDELVRRSPIPVLVDFWAAWCGPCRMVAPEVEKIAAGRVGDVVVAKVDTEALPEIAGRFDIRSIPTLIVFRGGREARRITGALPARSIEAELAL